MINRSLPSSLTSVPDHFRKVQHHFQFPKSSDSIITCCVSIFNYEWNDFSDRTGATSRKWRPSDGAPAHQKMKCHFYWEMWLESASVQLSFGASKYELWSGTIFEWRKEEKGNVFVEKEVFLLSQSGTLFRRSHTRKSWMGVTFGKDFLESLSRIPQLINLNFPNVFNWDHRLKSILNGGL